MCTNFFSTQWKSSVTKKSETNPWTITLSILLVLFWSPIFNYNRMLNCKISTNTSDFPSHDTPSPFSQTAMTQLISSSPGNPLPNTPPSHSPHVLPTLLYPPTTEHNGFEHMSYFLEMSMLILPQNKHLYILVFSERHFMNIREA